ncbi:permease [Novosphingobium sp. PC22D]|uniref:sulfite exporter TauE/SafE family protein n=1 Tax=Novosphingobium sp. PC22D TaxID=1962403 RepID=UPI000BEF1E3D|nr:sulfite exporter TauE/SafE family protein [Novosphingobium sp. PC22D]PEQ13873.1 permease [Novosphingobium sp. PC22D]
MSQFASLIVPAIALLAAGLAAGFAGGLFGIGGGFVVVPALVILLPLLGAAPGQVTHVAIGTSLATIIFTSLRSVTAHARRDAVDFSVLRSWAPWVAAGTVGGILLADQVSGRALAVIFGAGVLIFAAYFLMPERLDRRTFAAMPSGAVRISLASGLGLLSALLGIGGGTIATLVMTSCGTPIHRAIGTASGMGAVIALPGMIGFIAIGQGEAGLPWGSLGFVNLPAALAIVCAALVSAPWGVSAAHRLSPSLLRTVFGAYLVVVGVTMIANR